MTAIFIISFIGLVGHVFIKIDKKVEVNDLDALEYFTIAQNLNRNNGFPVMGFVTAESNYNYNFKCSEQYCEIGLQLFKDNGPITYFAKPPFYPIVLSFFYKLLGVKNSTNAILLLLLVLGSALLLMGITLQLLGNEKMIVALMVGCSFFILKLYYFKLVGPEPLALLLLLVYVYLAILQSQKRNSALGFSIGIVLALLILTKGSYLILVTLYFAYQFISIVKDSFSVASIRNFAVSILGFSLLIACWSFYANTTQKKVFDEQQQWAARIKVNIDLLNSTSNKNELNTEDQETYNPDLIKKLINGLYFRYINPKKKFILLTNQVQGDEILSVHNETSKSTLWNVSWRDNPNLYHNKYYQDKPILFRLFKFYQDNPKYIYQIANFKLKKATNLSHIFIWVTITIYCLTILLMILGNIPPKFKFMWLLMFVSLITSSFFLSIAPVFLTFLFCVFFTIDVLFRTRTPFDYIAIAILNGLFIVVIFYGNPRFLDDIRALSLVGSIYLITVLYKTLIATHYTKNGYSLCNKPKESVH